ncbi:MAG TPA: hypothetical protein VF133_15930 [Terriglobales bacterium]
MSNRIIQMLQDVRKAIQDQLKDVDTAISGLESAHPQGHPSDHPAIGILMQGRDRLEAQLQQIEIVINNVTALAEGKQVAMQQAASSESGRDRAPAPGQYAGMKLSTAVQAYLSERGRGPVLLSQAVRDLTIAGVLVGKHRQLPDTRDLRLLCANNRKRFQYDTVADTISLRTVPGNDTGRISVRHLSQKTA